jgi:hypothetical protein
MVSSTSGSGVDTRGRGCFGWGFWGLGGLGEEGEASVWGRWLGPCSGALEGGGGKFGGSAAGAGGQPGYWGYGDLKLGLYSRAP